MNKYYVCLLYLITSLTGYSQQTDTLKHSPGLSRSQESDELKLNRETQDDIRNRPFIGPLPERTRTNRFFEDEMPAGISRETIVDEGHKQDNNNQDSIPALQMADAFNKEMKALSKIYHQKTTVDDPQTLANPHITLSFNDILCYLFRPELRAKMRNKKHANAYKTY